MLIQTHTHDHEARSRSTFMAARKEVKKLFRTGAKSVTVDNKDGVTTIKSFDRAGRMIDAMKTKDLERGGDLQMSSGCRVLAERAAKRGGASGGAVRLSRAEAEARRRRVAQIERIEASR